MAGAPTPTAANQGWYQWAEAVLSGIGAPNTQNNLDSLWRWSVKESGGNPMSNGAIRNNPLNTKLGGAGSLSNGTSIPSYGTWSAGANATVATLQSYPNVVAQFRSSTASADWSPAARYELDTWAHGPHGVHDGKYAASFLGGTASPGVSAAQQTVQDVGKALSGLDPGALAAKILFLAGGGLLMLIGLIILALVLVRGAAAPAVQLASTASPIGRGLSVIQGGKKTTASSAAASAAPAEKPLSPQAQASVAAAKAGRGSKLSPEVKAELRAREKAS